MTDKAIRAEKKIEAIAQKCGVTERGKLWMDWSLDPFPDDTRIISGYPDNVQSKSVAQVFKSVLKYTVPSGCSEANIFFDKLHFLTTTKLSANVAGGTRFTQATQTTAAIVGGVTVRCGQTASPYLGVPTNVANIPAPFQRDTPHRLVSLGVEIRNTSPVLSRKGTVVAWRAQPTSDIPIVVNVNKTVDSPTSASTGHRINNVPETRSEAMQMAGSLEWDAADGAYLVGVLGQPTVPIVDANYGATYILTKDSNGTQVCYFSTIDNDGTSNAMVIQQSGNTAFDSFGAFFSGVELQDFEIVVHWGVERFPRDEDLDLMASATPSPGLDNCALELYNRVAHRLPVGVPVTENGLGDWIMGIAEVLGEFGVPGMGLVKSVVKGIEGVRTVSQKPPKVQKVNIENTQIKTLERKIDAMQQMAQVNRPEQRFSQGNGFHPAPQNFMNGSNRRTQTLQLPSNAIKINKKSVIYRDSKGKPISKAQFDQRMNDIARRGPQGPIRY